MKNEPEIQIGSQISLRGEIREIIEILANANNQPIIVWKSKHSEGACVSSLWLDWKAGIGENY